MGNFRLYLKNFFVVELMRDCVKVYCDFIRGEIFRFNLVKELRLFFFFYLELVLWGLLEYMDIDFFILFLKMIFGISV